MAGENNKRVIWVLLLSLLALITSFQQQLVVPYNLIFQLQQQQTMFMHLTHSAAVARHFHLSRTRRSTRGLRERLWRKPGRTDLVVDRLLITFHCASRLGGVSLKQNLSWILSAVIRIIRIVLWQRQTKLSTFGSWIQWKPGRHVCFFCPWYQELPSEGSLHGARIFLAVS